ncbi:uncharacterized protein LOC119374035 isoform X1 [Rhipicephalus sanguineus]|uniref:uncharacterized protein LOC119374035 isoform X1 n=1 Tax=Rhipicephalus sanguineus TaxID=34632 RepID=UPI00189380E5|nr:uncharacterized protein LOC119374035 isoform X1 [Rhipicephalus sanguineus]
MFKFTVLLLLCAAAISTRSQDVFRGCAATSSDPDLPGKCFQLPEYQFRNNKAYMGLAEEVLKLHSNHTTGRYVDTILRISRVVNQRAGAFTGGILVRLEFLNIRSKCVTPGRYSISVCKPVWDKPHQMCQAIFFLYNGRKELQRSWCRPILHIRLANQ